MYREIIGTIVTENKIRQVKYIKWINYTPDISNVS